MQSEQFTHNIRKKRVMSTDGKIIGQIKNISFDAKTGLLLKLVVRSKFELVDTGDIGKVLQTYWHDRLSC